MIKKIVAAVLVLILFAGWGFSSFRRTPSNNYGSNRHSDNMRENYYNYNDNDYEDYDYNDYDHDDNDHSSYDHDNDRSNHYRNSNNISTRSTNVGLINSNSTYNKYYHLKVYTYNNIQYVNSEEIEEYYFDEEYKFENDELEFEDNDYLNTGEISMEINNRTILSGIKVVDIDGNNDEYLMELSYFEKEIYPLIR
ncbi:MAG: hypothetical protein ACK5NF_02435 [Bacilli bacterium]